MLLKLLSASEAQKRTRKFYDDEEVQNKISMILSDINAKIVQSCDEGNNNVVVHVQCNTAAIISMVVDKLKEKGYYANYSMMNKSGDYSTYSVQVIWSI
jgi:glutamate dehydrogenase/leucine dehydrogenase